MGKSSRHAKHDKTNVERPAPIPPPANTSSSSSSSSSLSASSATKTRSASKSSSSTTSLSEAVPTATNITVVDSMSRERYAQSPRREVKQGEREVFETEPLDVVARNARSPPMSPRIALNILQASSSTHPNASVLDVPAAAAVQRSALAERESHLSVSKKKDRMKKSKIKKARSNSKKLAQESDQQAGKEKPNPQSRVVDHPARSHELSKPSSASIAVPVQVSESKKRPVKPSSAPPQNAPPTMSSCPAGPTENNIVSVLNERKHKSTDRKRQKNHVEKNGLSKSIHSVRSHRSEAEMRAKKSQGAEASSTDKSRRIRQALFTFGSYALVYVAGFLSALPRRIPKLSASSS